MRPQRIESQPKGLPQGDERPTKAHPFRSAVQCPRRHARHGTKTVDGSYTQADLRPSIVKTKYPGASFLLLRRVEDCFAINQSCGSLARGRHRLVYRLWKQFRQEPSPIEKKISIPKGGHHAPYLSLFS